MPVATESLPREWWRDQISCIAVLAVGAGSAFVAETTVQKTLWIPLLLRNILP